MVKGKDIGERERLRGERSVKCKNTFQVLKFKYITFEKISENARF